MGNQIKDCAPRRGATRDLIGQYLYKNGPATEADICNQVLAGATSDQQGETIQRALRSGWFTVTADGKIDCSASTRAHYDRLAGIVKVKPVGQIAAPRTNEVFARPPLSKKYIPNSRGSRLDIPAWSVRSGASFHTKA